MDRDLLSSQKYDDTGQFLISEKSLKSPLVLHFSVRSKTVAAVHIGCTPRWNKRRLRWNQWNLCNCQAQDQDQTQLSMLARRQFLNVFIFKNKSSWAWQDWDWEEPYQVINHQQRHQSTIFIEIEREENAFSICFHKFWPENRDNLKWIINMNNT